MTDSISPDNLSRSAYRSSDRTADALTGAPSEDTTDNCLSLFVLACEEHMPGDGDCFSPLSDIAWLQFIEGLEMHVVVDNQPSVAETHAADFDARGSGVWLVDDTGTVHSQWALPSKRQEVLSIGRTVEQTIDSWGKGR
ncbi:MULTISPECIES: hypothetical protein [Haloferax]|uniref:Uncharacterized protein n=2 Tax=Haloferax TaxID=2251 RepID=A0A6G1Z6Z6_9EURY|nr:MULTISPECIES: hypothetical protein [Haloferax]KAB1185013.1 hypothetical protein Hfx1149_15940 [Haloferax sp. CBA1149]MRW82188.1 hypothetical protein [Haloferax marinisediminis]